MNLEQVVATKQERWRRAEELFHAALDRTPEDRGAFLNQACGGDRELRQQVTMLISSDGHAGSFLEQPFVEVRASLPIGAVLGQYRVEEELGRGGMGVVYRAFDTQLRRPVALKVLPPEHDDDPDWQQSLLREARAAAALNHPNIIAVYEVGSDAGTGFIAMELVEGKPLQQIVPEGGLPFGQIVEFASQIAAALAKAHACGVIHRDLKPRNIMVTGDGLVKVLDFGLAKRIAGGEPETISMPADGIIGTPSYMSPEQARGEELDARTDLFSFGAVLYQMATGALPFPGAHTASVYGAVLGSTPAPLSRVSPTLPPELERIIGRALEKDREARYQSAKNMLADLLQLKMGANRGRRTASRVWAVVIGFVLLAVLAAWLYLGRRQTIDSLAVMPMSSIGSEYLSDGITESLIRSISRLPKLRVMSRTSVFRYKGREIDPKAVGRELGVQAVLISRLSERGNDVSISAELVDARDNSHIWGGQYNRTLADIQTLQEDIGRAIAEQLRPKLSGEQQRALTSQPPRNQAAYQDYLKGRYHWNKRSGAGLTAAIEYFHSAIAKDPDFALAYTGLADSYLLLSLYTPAPPRESLQKAKAAALKALAIDEAAGEAHIALGQVKAWYDYDWPGAEKEFKKAIELNPGYATAHHFYARYLATVGRLEEAIVEIKIAQNLDPLSLAISADHGAFLFWHRRADEAIEQLRQTLAMDANFSLAHFWLGRAYELKGMYPEAIAEFQLGLRSTAGESLSISGLAHAYALSGQSGEARKILAELAARSKRGFFSPALIATIHAALGEKDEAFKRLMEAVEQRDQFIIALKTGFLYDSLRGDPRFGELLHRLKLE